ncbi:SHOCT domain-containing protein [Salinisphaera hydrothermalis]|uniref:SHOCT domain-containing protein n=1 Tax=Salinisphaera hydrothermalis (strain C41B8) TaxID=1304275 RepID=A0A084IGX1_SALHC|nr:SHOCT domain-containing protein [Salinisphaera hydrothermalis]KEZ75955.1 hypothetical protein C41B8_17296 [Salinisphaera hydrothermalis C41B8]
MNQGTMQRDMIEYRHVDLFRGEFIVMDGKWAGVLAFLGTSVAATPAWAQYGSGGLYGPGMMWGGSWVGSIFGMVMMLLVFAAVIAFIVVAVRWLARQEDHHHATNAPPTGRPTALDILKERFARGEIDKKEFEEHKRHLLD